MGLEFKIVQSERKELDRVTCDRCGNEIERVSDGGWNPCGEPHAVYHEPGYKDFFLLDKSWGYGSAKDGETHQAVLCEPCYGKVFEGVPIQVTSYF